MKKVLIAVTPGLSQGEGRYYTSAAYFDALEACGAIPVLVSMKPEESDFEEVAKRVDGFLFSGGNDVSPDEYGQNMRIGCGEVQPERDRAELGYFRAAVRLDRPVLAICRGIQLINVAAGGTLYQDIPGEYRAEDGAARLLHSQHSPANVATQYVNVSNPSRLYGFVKEERIMVNSHHHQAVDRVGEGFVVTARADDGIIECIEKTDMSFCVGVQWHPEHLWQKDPKQKAIFEAFVKACRGE
ncbi:MAG: gamma-glutamyl-gamma-aminobutyrate hydrolase family protein [Clostridia bacterium]|nr:gamma-glutamyl-gamma-aminobutyrate hydrolase family protein [Clostridia bacterium]